MTNPETAESHNSPLTGRVDITELGKHSNMTTEYPALESKYREVVAAHGKQGERVIELEAELAALREREIILTERNKVLESELTGAINRENFWFRLMNERFPDEVHEILDSDRHRLATEGTKP